MQALALGLVLIGEFLLFQRMNALAAVIYPRWFDQVQYLKESYLGYEYSLDHGFLAGVWQTLVNNSAQGTLHDFWALLLFTLVRPSRAAALNVNMLWFLATQAVTFFAVRKASQSNVAAWVSVAFLVALLAPWSGEPGSIIDFRLDWMAACSYGTALGMAIASGGFRSTRWSVAFGFAVGVALLTRFLTGVYFGLILVSYLVWVLSQRDRWPRFWRLALSSVAASAIAAPIFWINRKTIFNYYWIGHVTGPERALRDSHLTPIESVRWVVRELAIYNIGLPALTLFAVTLGMAWFAAARWPVRADSPSSAGTALGGACFASLVFLFAPLAVLSIHPTKAAQTVSIMIVPATWIAVLGFALITRSLRQNALGWIGWVSCLAGGGVFLASVFRTPYRERVVEDSRKVSALVDYAYFRAEECDLTRPRLAVTLIGDGLGADAFSVVGYERHHHWIEFLQTLPTGLFETTEKLVLDRLKESDFVCLLSRPDADWPYDRQLQALLGVTRPWCESHLVRVADLTALGFAISLYERSGMSGTSAVTFATLLKAPGAIDQSGATVPPAAPIIVSSSRILWSADEDFNLRVRAAFSPLTYHFEGLPVGLRLDSRTGVIRGVVHGTSEFLARVTASNSRGTAIRDVLFRFGKGPFLTSFTGPASARTGVPIQVAYEAYNLQGRLDFIDINDLTARRFIVRLAAGAESHTGFQGIYPITFAGTGLHTVDARFVCYNPDANDPYTYSDETLKIPVGP